MSWILFALLAYLFLAISNLLDKFLVDNVLPDSKTYVFVACFLSGITILAGPWFLEWPGVYWLVINLVAGAIFAIALWSLYESLRRGEASRVVVIIGGLTPVFTVAFSVLFLKEHFSPSEWMGIIFILAGVTLVALLPKHRNFLARVVAKLKMTQDIKTGSLIFALVSAFAYAVYFMVTKYSYTGQSFASAFIWTRLGAALFVLLLLINAENRKNIFNFFKKSEKNKTGGKKYLVFFNQILGPVGFLLQNYAIFLGSVALVNALQGVQYALLLIISSFLAILSPKLLKETFSWKIFLQKSAAVVVIGLGMYFIMI